MVEVKEVRAEDFKPKYGEYVGPVLPFMVVCG